MAVSMLRCEEDTVRGDLRPRGGYSSLSPSLSLSLSLFGQEPDLTSKSSLDMNQHWRSRPDKAEGRETCTMFQIDAKTQGRGGTTSVSGYSQGRLMDVSDHMVALGWGRLHSQEVMSRVGSCAVTGRSSGQTKKKVLDLLSVSQLHKQKTKNSASDEMQTNFHECVTRLKPHLTSPPRDDRADWREVCLRECENECVCAHYDFLQPAFENGNTSLCSSGSQISRAWVSAGHNMRARTQSCGRLMTPHTVTTHTLTQIPQKLDNITRLLAHWTKRSRADAQRSLQARWRQRHVGTAFMFYQTIKVKWDVTSFY